jgi:23S rRNA pseudouridine1911/1915/1917 synthase
MKEISNKTNLQVLHEDNHIVVNKRVGDIVQGDKTGDKPLSEVVKEYIKNKYNKPGEVFLGVVHRLTDRLQDCSFAELAGTDAIE